MDTDLTEAAAPVDAFWANPKAFDKKRASEIDDVPLESWCITLNLFNLQQTAPMLQRAQNCADAHYHVNARRQKKHPQSSFLPRPWGDIFVICVIIAVPRCNEGLKGVTCAEHTPLGRECG